MSGADEPVVRRTWFPSLVSGAHRVSGAHIQVLRRVQVLRRGDRPWAGVRVDPFGLPALAGALIAIQMLLRGWAVWGSWFWQDDFVYARLAHDLPVLDFLTLDYHGHLQPLQFATVLALDRVAAMRWGAYAAVVLLLQLLADLAVLRLLVDVFGRRHGVLVPLVVFLFCPITLTPLLWFAAAIQSLPLQICLAAVLSCHVRLLRGASPRTEVVAALAYLVGLLAWEKALLVPFVALLLEALCLRRGGVGAAVISALRERWRLWTWYLGITLAYGVGYLLIAHPSGGGAATPGRVVRLLWETLGVLVIPGLFGGPWRGNGTLQTLAPPAPHPWDRLALLAAVAVLVASIWWRGWRAVRAWALLGVPLGVDIAVVAATRIGFLGPVVGRDGRYVAELVPVAALVVGLILLGPRPELPGDVRPGQFRDDAVRTAAVDGPRHLPWLIGAVVLGYVTSAGITTHAAALDRHHSLAQRWVATARDDLRRDPRAVVVDAPVPAQVLAPLFGVDARASRVLSAFGVPASRFNRTTDRLVVLDADGRLAPAQLIASARSGKGPEPGCGWRVDGRRRLPTGDALVASDWIVRVGYYAAAPNSLARLDVGGGEFTVSFPAGLGYVYVFPSGPVDGAELSGIGSDLPICVTDVAVGRAWPA